VAQRQPLQFLKELFAQPALGPREQGEPRQLSARA
jgi:hypothetical protein